jgi:mono/diheme cytochrome c family protein
MRMAVVVALCCTVVFAAALSSSKTSAQNMDMVARGRYLVGPAGACADCHGPTLHGQVLGFLRPGMPVQYKSANIAGLKFLTSAQAVTFLTTGVLPNGKRARPPMPEYRFNNADAQAIVAYLKSLK